MQNNSIFGQNSLTTRTKAQSYKLSSSSTHSNPFCEMEFSTLSLSMELTHHPTAKRISYQSLIEYITQALEAIYQKEEVGVRGTFKEFLKAGENQLRPKLQQRLSLLKYLEESLKFKSFQEIEAEMVKEWRKNPLLFSLTAIWGRCLLNHHFTSQEQFVEEYEKCRNLIANVSQFYFKGYLSILNSKKVETLSLIFDDTAHHIINALPDWREIYQAVLLKLMRGNGKISQKEYGINLEFDVKQLKVNQHYLDLSQEENQLPETTKGIIELSNECKVHEKVNLLKKIRGTFIREITASNQRIVEQRGIKRVSQLEKDDILDCMIYCIVMGQAKNIELSLKSLTLLVGNSDLLSRKGVDSYRADLEGAVQYLCFQQLSSPLIKWPKNHQSLSTQHTFFSPL